MKYHLTCNLIATVLLFLFSLLPLSAQTDSTALASPPAPDSLTSNMGRAGNDQSLPLLGLGQSKSRGVVKMEKVNDSGSNKVGIVLVEVCIDGTGKAVSSKYVPSNDTPPDEYLINLALENVLKWVFTTSDTSLECVKITYNFK